ncbi:beta-lactamase family protein [Polaribacter litorisediminis]|uniref:serine hydrolase domain-containing protein n=1 Tax=Polaribacter litorisediminis TaxID=1908341 RepID=UPI001CBF8772|nr:serine hydrolase domain-containing protein [Polaribacter litorisediminis]UAM98886.1 beta-lactamase family protein [Polaribacter litorisediminis]
MKKIIATLLITLSIFSMNAQESIPQQTKIDKIFSRWNAPNSPGGTVGIIKDGKLIFTKGYGMANLDYNIPNDPKTVFSIASTSKQFTAASIIFLSEQGKLSLEDTLMKFFPNFPDYANEVTVQHLLNHTSGIRDYIILARLSGLTVDDYYTNEIVEKLLTNQQELNFTPGDEYLYSNSGYWLLGQIVEKVSGFTLAEFAKKNIFDPLEMKDTHFHDNQNQIVKNRATGYRPDRKGGYYIYNTKLNMIGDGGVITNVNDLAKWDATFYHSNLFNKGFWDKMTENGILNDGSKINYAKGLNINTYKGLKTITHSGGYVGYRTEFIRFPEAQFSVIILANRTDTNPTRMVYMIADLFLEDEYKKENSTQTKKSSPEIKDFKSITLTKKELNAFEGFYWDGKSKMSRELKVRNDTLNYVRNDGSATMMVPISKNKFKLIGPRVPVICEMSSNGNTKEFTLNLPNAAPITYVAYKPITAFSETDLESYSGDYYSKELDAVYTLKTKKDRMLLIVKGNPIGEVKPIMKDVINIRSRQTFEFNKERTAFRLSMLGRVKNIKFVKR